MIQPEIVVIPSKKLICTSLRMSLNANRTFELWKSFMPRVHEVQNRISEELISLQVYENTFDGNPVIEFVKYACVEVSNYASVPVGCSTLDLDEGLYAVFHYKGLAGNPEIFRYIFAEWLPQSVFELDNRPHFEVLGAKYKNNDPNSEEDICIPIKKRFVRV